MGLLVNCDVQMAEQALSTTFSSQTFSKRISAEVKEWFGIMFHVLRSFSRVLRVGSPATNFVIILFIQSLTYVRALPNVQPWPLKVERTCLCCTHTTLDFRELNNFNSTEVKLLQTCLKRQQNLTKQNGTVSIVTYSSIGAGDYSIADIDEFAVYQRGLVSAYAETNDYVYKHFDAKVDRITFDGENDPRWLKIKILLDALNGWAKHTAWIVWIDADAIFLDYGLNVEELGSRHPQADILASADIRMGLINTGVLVLRNTPWLRQFLKQWWYGPHESASNDAGRVWRSVCDQDAFDHLYSHYTKAWTEGKPHIRDKVKVLPMDALNSHPPAMVHQRAESAVLHLMGESTALRRELFRRGWGTLCAARSGGVLPLQLGLQRDVLLRYARAIYTDAAEALVGSIKNASVTDAIEQVFATNEAVSQDEVVEESRLLTVLVFPLQELSKAVHHLCDVLRHLHAVSSDTRFQHEEVQWRKNISDLVTARVDEVRDVVANLTASLVNTRTSLQALDSASDDLNLTQTEPVGLQNEVETINLMLTATETARRRRSLLSVQVQLLKRAAEAGNDIFGATPLPVDKLRVAMVVLAVLNELEDNVEESSKHVPMHMRALMHQSLGILEHSLATEVVTKPPSGKIPNQELSSAHLREAHKHLSSSVAIFRAIGNLSHSFTEDSSSLMEVSLSLQLLAGVTCALGKYQEGAKRWEDAIEQARSSLKGIKLGVRFDNLAVVLYNAAVCFSSAQNFTRVELLLAEAQRILDASAGGTLSSPFRRQVLELRARNAHALNPHPVKEQESPKTSVPIHTFMTPKSAKLDRPGIMRPVIDTVTGKVSYVRKEAFADVKDTPVQLQGEEEEEWEECDLDEACDEFVVDELDVLEEQTATLQATAHPPSQALHPIDQHQDAQSSQDVLEGVDVDGMSEEEVAELREVRRRYARQQKRQTHTQTELFNTAGTVKYADQKEAASLVMKSPLESLTAQLAVLQAAHVQQGKLIEQIIKEMSLLQKIE